jgi:hypothetical protein
VIYFIVNNNYQYYDFAGHLSTLKSDEVCLIEIPHTLDERQHVGLKSIFTYSSSAKYKITKQIVSYISSIRRINNEITPKSTDTLFFYTEYEILNQYLVSRFKDIGARIFLIEDGGFGTYVPFRVVASEILTFKEAIKMAIYRRLPGLSNICFHKLNGHIFPRLPDNRIDSVLLYYPLKIARTIDVKLLKRPYQKPLHIVPNRVIFLNEALYEIYQDSGSYLHGLEQIISHLCKAFDEVIFKFHPRETLEWRQKIRDVVLSRYSKVCIIEENFAIEEVIEAYVPSVAASYFCSALLSLCDRGIQPLYLYHLIPEIEKQPVFIETTKILTEMGYIFVKNWSNIDSTYKSGLTGCLRTQDALNLRQIVEDFI